MRDTLRTADVAVALQAGSLNSRSSTFWYAA
jgi:hypothetical protein